MQPGVRVFRWRRTSRWDLSYIFFGREDQLPSVKNIKTNTICEMRYFVFYLMPGRQTIKSEKSRRRSSCLSCACVNKSCEADYKVTAGRSDEAIYRGGVAPGWHQGGTAQLSEEGSTKQKEHSAERSHKKKIGVFIVNVINCIV